jgi:hypothetical protein
VVGVVEEEGEAGTSGTGPTQVRDDGGIRPFVDEHNVGLGEPGLEVGLRAGGVALQLREADGEIGQRGRAGIGEQAAASRSRC